MTIEQMLHFSAAASTLSFTRAADKLFVHQSSISRSMANLERELNVELFVRDKKTLRLTEAGEYLQKECARLLADMDEVTANVRRIGMGMAGKLRITGNTFYSRMLSPAYKLFRDLYPDVEVSMLDRREEDLYLAPGQLLSGEFDMGVLFLDDKYIDPEQFEMINIYSERVDMIVPPGHKLYNKKSVSIEELAGQYAILAKYMYPKVWLEVNEKLLAKGLEPVRIQPESERAATESELMTQIFAGFGISAMPRLLSKSFLGMSTTAFTDADDSIPLWVVYAKSNRNPTVKLFAEVLRGCMFRE